MFGRSGLGSTVSASTTLGQSLVEFKAGRMNLVGNVVHPDTRKGLVSLIQSQDRLIHFCWEDRNTGKVEDDLIVFPDDFEFKKVEQCKTGRVFVLIFKSSPRRMFFWMQEPSADKDEDFCRRVNDVMNNPPTGNSSSGSGRAEGNDLQYMLNNMSQQQLMQLFGGVQMGGLSSLLGSAMNRDGSSKSARTGTPSRGSTSTSTAATPSTPENSTSATTPKAPAGPRAKSKTGSLRENVRLSDLQSCLSALSPSVSRGSRGNIDLTNAITSSSEVVNKLISDPETVQKLATHLPDLGESSKADPTEIKQQVKDTITSPQFQQAMSLFSNALQSGQLGPVVQQFEVTSDAVAAATTGDMEQFVKALEKKCTTKDKEPIESMDEDESTSSATEKKE